MLTLETINSSDQRRRVLTQKLFETGGVTLNHQVGEAH